MCDFSVVSVLLVRARFRMVVQNTIFGETPDIRAAVHVSRLIHPFAKFHESVDRMIDDTRAEYYFETLVSTLLL